MSPTTTSSQFFLLVSIISLIGCNFANGQLSPNFYATTCSNLQTIVRDVMSQTVTREPRMGASILRLFFHDCFVQLGGQSWQVPLGRRDSRTASLSGADSDLPSPFADLPTLISMFAAKGLTAQDMTVLSGGHAIGFSKCLFFRTRIYNETNIDPAFATARRANCPFSGGDTNLGPFDNTPNRFDNNYYQNLVAQRGLLHSDQVLFNNGSQDATVRTYSTNAAAFLRDFGAAMVKMGNISPLTGTDGEIRKSCGVINS
ncbi:hypothetical protein LWI28_004570 [Acer negundo]|uniref:peroxidase n=1 Tax=Acer negundo TaxID=4023 RepID=A0AAD5ITN3_ACENE|nr:hypothetical protein LWI28_004570 [Acer negundo]